MAAGRPPTFPARTWTSLYGEADADHYRAGPEDAIHRLVLWNVDLTLVDVARVTRAAYAVLPDLTDTTGLTALITRLTEHGRLTG